MSLMMGYIKDELHLVWLKLHDYFHTSPYKAPLISFTFYLENPVLMNVVDFDCLPM